MGDFNVGCGISNLSISEGERVGLLLLLPSKYHHSFKTMYSSCDDLFHPFGNPIYGTYDSYGSLTDIEETATTRIFEKLFHLPIEDILQLLTGRHEVYGGEGAVSQYLASSTYYYNPHKNSDILLQELGFDQSQPEDNIKVYTFEGFSLTSESKKEGIGYSEEGEERFNSYSLWSIHKVGESTPLARSYRSLTEALDHFSELTKKYPGVHPGHWERIRILRELKGMFFLREVKEKMVEYVDSNTPSYERKWASAYLDHWDEYIGLLSKRSNTSGKDAVLNDITLMRNPISDKLLQSNDLPFQYHSLLSEYATGNELFEYLKIEKVLNAVNRMYMPTFNGQQYGDFEALAKLNKIAKSIIQENL